MSYTFGENTKEYSAKTGNYVPVILTEKYKSAKKKAIEIIDSKKYGVQESDFWILMNATKDGSKMMYTGLIISHNGCLKINDGLSEKFVPSCVTEDKGGYKGSLVYTYSNDAQGIYEVGEANDKNCKNDYPYAMAYKRLFDRVVLKLSKLAYNGVYSDSESDEFREPDEHAAGNQQASDEPFDTSVPIYATPEQVAWLNNHCSKQAPKIFERFAIKSLEELSYKDACIAIQAYEKKLSEQKAQAQG